MSGHMYAVRTYFIMYPNTLFHVAEINEKMLDCAHYAYIKQTLILANKFGKWEREQSSIFILYV